MPCTITLDLPDLSATHALARRLAGLLRAGDMVLLEGPLGAGKSELARAVLRAAAADPALEVPSPTFTLVQTYDLPAGPAHHFDLYRLDGPDGLAELGWDEAREGIVLVEWPDRLGGDRPAEALHIALEPGAAEDARRATLTGWDSTAGAAGRMRDARGFLAAAGFGAARLAPLASDASFRRYARVTGGPRPAMLMDAPPPEDVRPFLSVRRHIAGIGLSAPGIIAADEDAGFLLIEDFGDATHAALLDAGAEAMPLYLEAAETLAALHATPPPAGLPAWGPEEMARATAATFLDWWWPAAFGRDPDSETRAALDAAIVAMLAPFARQGCIVHRDYFPANLMRLPDRAGPRRTGLIDFQDAARGSPGYDLVSLVEDARRDVAPDVRAAAIARYLDARPGLDRGEFAAAMAACAAQRHLRVAALWVRLARRDGKPAYLVHGPRCWRLLGAALAHPATRPLRDFLDARVPAELRGTPMALTEPV